MLPKKHRLVARMTATAMLAAGTAAAVALPATAETVTPQTEVTAEADPMLQAMQRDLGLTAQEAQQRLEQESVARTLDETLRAKLQDNFGGSYYDADTGTLVVGVTEASALDDVRAAGAKAKLVDASIDELNTAVDRLDRKESSAPESVTGWYVDVKNNSVVVTTAPGTAAQAEKFVAASGVDGDNVEIVESTEQPRTFMDVIGGNAYYMGNGGRCSVGFTVQGGFVTAGHCGTTGTSTSSPSGTFAGRRSRATTTPSSAPVPVTRCARGSTCTTAPLASSPAPAWPRSARRSAARVPPPAGTAARSRPSTRPCVTRRAPSPV